MKLFLTFLVVKFNFCFYFCNVKQIYCKYNCENVNTTASKFCLSNSLNRNSKNNHTIIVTIFNRAMHVLWPEGVRYQRIFVLIIDGAKYIIKVTNALKVLYSHITHVTCTAYDLQ